MLVRYRVPIVSALFLLGILSALLFFRNSATIIVRNGQGFFPSRVLIHRGDTVTFVSHTSQPFWPASDSHPTHTLYSAFDSKRPLSPDEEWQFTFEEAGVWNFHDHLHPSAKGVVLVVGDDGDSIAECLKTKSESTIKPECWEADLLKAMDTKGLDAAFDAVRSWYAESPAFRNNCHDVMHIIGAESYRRLSQGSPVYRPETSYCGYGFFHGFTETMLAEQGSGQFSDVRAYCEAVAQADPQATGPCYHGIGHAIFDSLDSSLWGNDALMVSDAVGTCEKALAGEFERARCASGVYNALANAYSVKNYELSFRDAEPIPICHTQRKEYQWFCYAELGNGYIRDKHWAHAESIAFIQALPKEAWRGVTTGYFDTETRRTIDDLNTPLLHSLCLRFEDAEIQKACVDGVLIGLRGEGEPDNEEKLITQFCDAFMSGPLQDYCRAGHGNAP